jgi:hypothetical protein
LTCFRYPMGSKHRNNEGELYQCNDCSVSLCMYLASGCCCGPRMSPPLGWRGMERPPGRVMAPAGTAAKEEETARRGLARDHHALHQQVKVVQCRHERIRLLQASTAMSPQAGTTLISSPQHTTQPQFPICSIWYIRTNF